MRIAVGGDRLFFGDGHLWLSRYPVSVPVRVRTFNVLFILNHAPDAAPIVHYS